MRYAEKEDEVIESFQEHDSRSRGTFSCCLFLLVVFFCIIGFVVWQIAASGLVSVPVVSSFAYHEVKPTRVVSKGESVESVAETYFKTTLNERLIKGQGTLTDRSVHVSFSEAALTGSLQKAVQKSALSWIDFSRAQIVVLPNELFEFYVPVQYGGQTTTFTAHFSLQSDAGIFKLDLKDVKIGSSFLPSFLFAYTLQPFVNRELSSLNQALSTYMHVDSLKTEEGIVNVIGSFTVSVKN